MYRKIILVILLFCFSVSVFAQVEVKPEIFGYVLLYNKSQGIQGISIKKDNGQVERTDSKGFFKINFSGEETLGQARLKVQLPRIGEYQNYAVMEVDGLYHYINDISATIGRNKPVIITLCPPEIFEKRVLELAKPYIDKRLKEKEKEIIQLEEKLAKSELTNSEYNKQQQYIEDVFNIDVGNIEELARKFARIDSEFADENLKQALEYFKQGNIENAEKCLPNLEQIEDDIVRGKRTLYLLVSISKTKGKEKIYEVQQRYERLLKHTGEPDERFNLLIEYSEYLFLNKIFNTALVDTAYSYANKAKNWALSENLSIDDKIYSYNLLGKIQKEQKNSNYFNNYKIAIDAYKSQTNNGSARKNVAISYTQLADYYKYKNNYRKTEDNYLKALDIYIEMYNNKESDNFNQMEMLISLATFYTEANKYDLVKQCNDRIAILSKTVSDPDKQAELNYKMGYFYMVGGQYYTALNTFNEALQYYEKKDKESTLLYENKVLATNLLIALVYSYKYDADHKQTIRYCNEVIKRVENTHSITPEYLRMKGFAYALTANAHKQLGNKKEYKVNLDKAKNINKKANDKELTSFIRFSKNNCLYSSDFNVWLIENLGFGLWITFFMITMI